MTKDFETSLRTRLQALGAKLSEEPQSYIRRDSQPIKRHPAITASLVVSAAAFVIFAVALTIGSPHRVARHSRTETSPKAKSGVSTANVEPTTSPGSSSPSSSSQPVALREVPSITDVPFDAATARLRERGFTGIPAFFSARYIASDTFPPNVVMSQGPLPGARWPENAAISITVSAGGPSIAFSSLPQKTQQFARGLNNYDVSEPVLVTSTPSGKAYKTDFWLFGQCTAVMEAYRTYMDASYDRACY